MPGFRSVNITAKLRYNKFMIDDEADEISPGGEIEVSQEVQVNPHSEDLRST